MEPSGARLMEAPEERRRTGRMRSRVGVEAEDWCATPPVLRGLDKVPTLYFHRVRAISNPGTGIRNRVAWSPARVLAIGHSNHVSVVVTYCKGNNCRPFAPDKALRGQLLHSKIAERTSSNLGSPPQRNL